MKKRRDFTDEELSLYEVWYKEKLQEFLNNGSDDVFKPAKGLDYDSFFREVVVSHRRGKKLKDLGI
jgi:hypothetical protein